ncbi:hypothetical protein BMS3Bbin02_00675 [bacterium BMS3Bbin02]|nr:hypothetical protein BMS3Bbin02_00675 [bacterium BMS3Bbin02]
MLILGGLAAGFINALAGGGSAITLPILTEIAGPLVANGTNRIAILAANLAATAGFHRGGAVEWRRVWPLIPPTVVGAGFGAWAATRVDGDSMKRIFAVVLILIAASVVMKPARWVAERESSMSPVVRTMVFLGVGFYGGFVQAGVGFLLLISLVLGSGFNLVNGNGAKVVLVLAYTPVALALFASVSQVDWKLGAILASGQMTGAWIAARVAVKKGAPWVRWVLVLAAVVAAGRMLVS